MYEKLPIIHSGPKTANSGAENWIKAYINSSGTCKLFPHLCLNTGLPCFLWGSLYFSVIVWWTFILPFISKLCKTLFFFCCCCFVLLCFLILQKASLYTVLIHLFINTINYFLKIFIYSITKCIAPRYVAAGGSCWDHENYVLTVYRPARNVCDLISSFIFICYFSLF